jgi:hypothetical protein
MSEAKATREKRTILKEIEMAAPVEAVWKELTVGTERAGRIRCGLRLGRCGRGGLRL